MADGKWRFGTITVAVPGEEYGLDEDGWIKCRTRLTARDFEVLTNGGSMFAVVPELMMEWSLKVAGEEVPFDRDTVLDLPIEIIELVFKDLQTQPFFEKYLAAGTTPPNSDTSTLE